MSDHIPHQLSTTTFSTLSTDLTIHILSLLPIPTLLRASAVCKTWHSIISDQTFSQKHQPPWFFLLGLHNISSKNNQSFAFDPSSNSWFVLPNSVIDSDVHTRSTSFDFQGSNGFFFTTTSQFSYTPILKRTPCFTSPLHFSRIYPLIGVFNYNDAGRENGCKFIIVGGVSFVGNLVDIEDRLAVEIYDRDLDTWELCPPLPSDFLSGNSAKLSSAMLKHKFYVFGIYSFFLSAFDIHKREWSEVQIVRPPGVLFSFLIACENHLILAGMCNNSVPHGGLTFNLYKVEEETMEFTEIGSMPQSLLCGLVDGDEDDNGNKYASLKCVGLGNLIYVFNEHYHKKYPACVCEISSETAECRWRRLPELPSPANKFHKVISFCSEVSVQNLLSSARDT
ncbi:hypothetical protein ACFE04_002687 [Oxalis oulophora]